MGWVRHRIRNDPWIPTAARISAKAANAASTAAENRLDRAECEMLSANNPMFASGRSLSACFGEASLYVFEKVGFATRRPPEWE
jgi:hypothetical protein